MYKIIAHRGYHNDFVKENTYLAIKKAINNKNIIGIEFDIHLTKDNKIVVIHDSNIKRTSNGLGKVEDMTLLELQKYNFGTKSFWQTIPTLDKIIDLNTNKILLIEIKCDNNEKKFAQIIANYLKDFKPNIYFISFNKKVLNYLDKKYLKGCLKIRNIDNKYDIILINKLFYKEYKSSKKIFIYTIDNYYELSNDNLYYICDNLDNILKKINNN